MEPLLRGHSITQKNALAHMQSETIQLMTRAETQMRRDHNSTESIKLPSGPSRNSMLPNSMNTDLGLNKSSKGLSIPAIDYNNLKFKSKERILNLSSTIDVSARKLKTK